MAKVRVAAFSISLDGFGAGPRQDIEHPLGVRGTELHSWFFETQICKKMRGQSAGSHGIDNDFAVQSFESRPSTFLGHCRQPSTTPGTRTPSSFSVRCLFGPSGLLGANYRCSISHIAKCALIEYLASISFLALRRDSAAI